MNSASLSFTRSKYLGSALLDILGLLFVYFVPSISHLLNFPLYLLEPMRIMVVLAMVHTHRKNAYILALTLPLFSFLVSAHPHFLKSLLITAELVLNVWLFYAIFSRMKNAFAAIIFSVVLSKIFYYLIKFFLITALLIEGGLVSTPIYIQLIMTVIFGLYMAMFLKQNR
ncbi:MAG: hypothetical protein K9G58_04015 [Bacteroidales bacterium]|nr:hypothetical protein [Bacteroidales bacterium]MCF8387400.1 hypothetical protein [Bacteroidales bacterium]MCF8397309.1 hypothetical protein [Bacteroidales bacterium]